MTKLKLCPFCGGEAELVEDLHDYPGDRQPNLDEFYVQCKSCHIVPNSWGNSAWSSRKKAIEAWNTRQAMMAQDPIDIEIENPIDVGSVLTLYVCRTADEIKTKSCNLRATDHGCSNCNGEDELKLGVLQKKHFEEIP